MKLLGKVASKGIQHAVKGQATLIRFIPDPFTAESMNIGVCFIDENRKVHTRYLDSFHRLKCLYDDRICESDMKYTLTVLDSAIPERLAEGSAHLDSLGVNIAFGPLMFAQGESVEAILNRIYHDAVTLAVPFSEERPRRNQGVDTTSARKLITSDIRKIMPMGYNQIVAENNMYTFKSDDGKVHALDIPLRGAKGGFLGTMISACQSEMIVKQNLMEATMDLHLARLNFKDDRMACFVLRDENIDERRQRQVDNAIDKLDWKIKAQGVQLEVESSPVVIANKIIEWSGVGV